MKKMKYLVEAGCLALALTTAIPAALAGGDSSGGGNRPKSSEAEVKKAVDELGDITAAINGFARPENLFNPAYATDPVLKRALQYGSVTWQFQTAAGKIPLHESGVFGSRAPEGTSFMPATMATSYELKDHCYDHDGKESEASTDFAPGPICLNKTLLMKYSPQELRLQLGALAIHEQVHKSQPRPETAAEWDAREAEARAVQDHVLKNLVGVFPYLDHVKESWKPMAGGGFSYSVSVSSMRPGGSVDVKRNGKSIRISCSRAVSNVINLDDRVADEQDLLLAPGAMITVPDGKGRDGKRSYTALTCLDLPRVRCSIGKIGSTTALFVGDYRGSYELESARAAMKHLVKSGRCEEANQRGTESQQGSSGNDSGATDAR